MTGALVHPGYDTARALWNGSYDRRPAVIACCASAADVAAAVGSATDDGLEGVRAGAEGTLSAARRRAMTG